MRVNVYAEEMTDRVQLRAVLHRDGQLASVTFWGKRDLRDMLRKALSLLDEHYADQEPKP